MTTSFRSAENRSTLVLSTIGISILTNVLSPDERSTSWNGRLTQAATARELTPEVAAMADALAVRVGEKLETGSVVERRRLSAELNGLYGYYDGDLSQSRGDVHMLVTTDTALGRLAAASIETFMRTQGLVVVAQLTPERLSAASRQDFSHGIKILLSECEKLVSEYRGQGYRVVFNLTGGFKSLQGYLTIAGMFYADEIIYIFESGDEILTIPRLPIRIDDAALQEHRVELAMMAQGHVYEIGQVEDIPAALLDLDDANATLSDWGQLVWLTSQQSLLSEELLSFPRLQYTADFRAEFRRATEQERVQLQQTLAKVSTILEASDGDPSWLKRDNGLQYDNYVNQKSGEGRAIGHFRLTQSRRVSCTAGDGGLRLRHFGAHNYVNNNP